MLYIYFRERESAWMQEYEWGRRAEGEREVDSLLSAGPDFTHGAQIKSSMPNHQATHDTTPIIQFLVNHILLISRHITLSWRLGPQIALTLCESHKFSKRRFLEHSLPTCVLNPTYTLYYL